MKPFQPLVPAKRGFEAPYPTPSEAPLKKRNIPVCDFCRAESFKCDGMWPICQVCSLYNLVCLYSPQGTQQDLGKTEQTQARKALCEEFMALIQGGTENHAMQAIRSLRAGIALEAIVNQSVDKAEAPNVVAVPRMATHMSISTDTYPAQVPSLPLQNRYHTAISGAASQRAESTRQLQHDFDVLAKRTETLQEILDLLRNTNEDAAQRLLLALRTNPDVTAILHAQKAFTHPRLLEPRLPDQQSRNAPSLLPSSLLQTDAQFQDPTLLPPQSSPAPHSPNASSLLGPNLALAAGTSDENAQAQDPWASDPVTIWELPRSGS